MTELKIWVDDIRVPTKEYFWTKTVKDTIIHKAKFFFFVFIKQNYYTFVI